MDKNVSIESACLEAPGPLPTNELDQHDAEFDQAETIVCQTVGEQASINQQDSDPETNFELANIHSDEADGGIELYILQEDQQIDDEERVESNQDKDETGLLLMFEQEEQVVDPELADHSDVRQEDQSDLAIHLEVQEVDPDDTVATSGQPFPGATEERVADEINPDMLFVLVEQENSVDQQPTEETAGYSVWLPKPEEEVDHGDPTEPIAKIESSESPPPAESRSDNTDQEPAAKRHCSRQIESVVCFCGRRFRDENSLNLHRQRLHGEQPADGIDRTISLKCPICPAVLVTQLRFENHLRTHAKPRPQDQDSLDEYVKRATRQALVQHQMERSCISAEPAIPAPPARGKPSSVARRGRMDSSVMLRCPECPAILVTEIRFQNHLKRDHPHLKREKT